MIIYTPAENTGFYYAEHLNRPRIAGVSLHGVNAGIHGAPPAPEKI
jgi:hypothetical protein